MITIDDEFTVVNNVAFIPARGGSKSIPLKYIQVICGKPLIYWAVKAVCECNYIDKVYVATDSDEIKTVVNDFRNGENGNLFSKLEVIGRSVESAKDSASTEYAMLEFAEKYNFENIALVQATSPLLQSEDLDRGFKEFFDDNVDSVLSVVRQKRFNWSINPNGYAKAINYDIFQRPRRQEFDGYLVENGAFYITSRNNLLKSKNRLSGNVKVVEMCEDSFLEIDEPRDWKIIEVILNDRLRARKNTLTDIKMFLTDCDGCLTDGGMYYSENGDEMKKFNTRDGIAFQSLKKYGIITGIVTGEKMKLNDRRAKKIGVDYIIGGCSDKLSAVKDICKRRQISMNHVCYVGDEINDIELMENVGYCCCPADANAHVRTISDYISPCRGGSGVIRDVVDCLFNTRGK